MVLYAEFVRALVESEEHRKASAREFASVCRANYLFGHAVHHPAVYDQRRAIGDDMPCGDPSAVLKHDAFDAAVRARLYLDRLGVEPYLAAQLPDPLAKRERDLV